MNNIYRRLLVMAVVAALFLLALPALAEDLPLYDPGYPYYGYEVMPEGTQPDDTEGGPYVYAPHPSMDYTDYMFMHYVGWKPTEEETEGQPLLYVYPTGNSFGFSGDSLEKAVVPAGAVTAGFSRNLDLVSVDMSRARNLKFLSMDACYKVKTLDIPYGVEGVMLNHLTGLTSLTIPPTVKFLELWHLDSLTNLTIPDGVEYLSVRDCGRIQSLVLPGSVKAVFRHAFKGCSSLSSMTIYGDPVPDFSSDASPFKGTKISSIYMKDADTENALRWKAISGKTVKPIDGAYAVHYVHSSEGEEIVSNAKAGSMLVRPVDPVREGYKISGWYQDAALTQEWDFAADRMPQEDLTLFAGWKKQCRIRFSLNNGMRMLDMFVAPGERVAEPIIPTKDGYRFTGWYRDSACTKPWRFERDVVENDTEMTLYAGWKYVVTAGLVVDGSKAVLGEIAFPQEEIVIPSVMAGKRITGLGECCIPSGVKKIVIPEGVCSIDKHAFVHASDLTEIVVDSMNTAYFARNGVLYSADGVLICYPQAKSDTQFAVDDDVKRVGPYAFMHAQSLDLITFGADTEIDSTAFEGADGIRLAGPVVAPNLIAFSNENGMPYNQYAVRFVSEGKTLTEKLCRAGEMIPEYRHADREDYILLGWRDRYTGVLWDFETDVLMQRDVTLDAQWQYAFAYEQTNQGVVIKKYLGSSLRVKVPSEIDGVPVTTIAADAFEEREGLVLAGDRGSAAQAFAGQMGYAFELLTYQLSFETNGGTLAEPQMLCASDAISLPEVSRYNHRLVGWYTDEELNQTFEAGTVMPAEDLTLYAMWEEIDHTDAYVCESYGGGLKIVAYRGKEQIVEVPSAMDGLSVLAIGEYAFSETPITSIILPDSITKIEQCAFKNCASLELVTLPANLTEIEEGLFEGCGKLRYYNHQYLELLYNRPIRSIAKRAFSGSGLAYLYIPATVQSIDIRAFEDCYSLNEVYVQQGNAHFASYEDVLYDSDMQTLMYYPRAKKDYSYTVPESVRTIGAYAVQNNDYLVDMMGMTAVECIEEGAFKDCDNLWIWQVGSALQMIGASAFENCGRIALSSIPDSVLEIASRAFAGCRTNGVNIGPNTEIADDAFDPKNVGRIYGVAGSPAHEWAKEYGVDFSLQLEEQPVWIELDWLYTEMEIGESLKLNYSVYPEDAENRNVEWSSSAPHIASVDENGIVTALFEGDARIAAVSDTLNKTELLLRVRPGCPEVEKLTLIPDMLTMSVGDVRMLETEILPANAQNVALSWSTSDPGVAVCTDGMVKAIGAGSAIIALSDGKISAQCLIRVYDSALVLPDQLKTVPQEAFAGTAVSCVECPEGLESIDSRAFAGCGQLERISMGAGVKYIAGDAFERSEAVVIYAPENSYAIQWAKENGVSYQEE